MKNIPITGSGKLQMRVNRSWITEWYKSRCKNNKNEIILSNQVDENYKFDIQIRPNI